MAEQTVTFQLDNQLFITTPEIISRSAYLTNLISGKWKEKADEIIIIDRSPRLFMEILEHLRNRKYKVPENCRDELDFFAISYTEDDIDHTLSDLIRKVSELSGKRCKLCELPFTSNSYNICPECLVHGWDSDCRVFVKDKGITLSSQVVVGDEVCYRSDKYSKVTRIFRRDNVTVYPLNSSNYTSVFLTKQLLIFACDSVVTVAEFNKNKLTNSQQKNVINFELDKAKRLVVYPPNSDQHFTVKTY